MPGGKRVGQTVHPIAHAWDQLVAKPFDSMMEGIRGAGHSRARPRAAGSSSATPLEGAIVFVLRYQSTTVSLLQTVAALGGTEAVTLEEATHCLVPSGLGLGVSPATRRVLRQAKEKSIPVVESTWLQIVAGLSAAEHWSEVSLDSHVPPVMAVVHGDFRASDCRRADGRRSQPVSLSELSASEISEIAASEISLSEISFSLDETWAYMRRGQPEEVEAGELRRAMELSLLDRAVSLRSAVHGQGASSSAQLDATRAAHTLGVAETATAAQLRAAYRAKAMKAHPDKGGKRGDFEKLQLAYRLLLRDAEGAERGASDSPLDSGGGRTMLGSQLLEVKPTASRDYELREHRNLVEQIFEQHGSDAAAFAARQAEAMHALGLEVLDVGASNRNETGAMMSNQCFYLALAYSYLGSSDGASEPSAVALGGVGEVSLLHETALHLKRVIEAAVLRAHPEWAGSRVGEDVQAFSDFLFFTLDSPTLVSELAVACFDAESGFVEVYKGRSYPEQRSEAEQRANLLTIRYVPGHYQALVATPGHLQPTLRELLAGLDARGVLHVVTDG